MLDEEQQAVYARVTDKQAVIVAFNNDTKPAMIEFNVSALKIIANGATLVDRLGKAKDVSVKDGKINVELPARYAAILTLK